MEMVVRWRDEDGQLNEASMDVNKARKLFAKLSADPKISFTSIGRLIGEHDDKERFSRGSFDY